MNRKPTEMRRGDPRGVTHVGLEKLAVVRAEGNVDRAGIEALDYLIMRAGDVRGAVVDLSHATHVDYRATSILVARRRQLKARGGELAVAAGRREVRDVLRASGGGDVTVFVTVDEALAFVRGDAEVARAGAAKAAKK